MVIPAFGVTFRTSVRLSILGAANLKLFVDVAETGEFDRIVAAGNVVLDGQLSLALLDAYASPIGLSRHDVATWPARFDTAVRSDPLTPDLRVAANRIPHIVNPVTSTPRFQSLTHSDAIGHAWAGQGMS